MCDQSLMLKDRQLQQYLIDWFGVEDAALLSKEDLADLYVVLYQLDSLREKHDIKGDYE